MTVDTAPAGLRERKKQATRKLIADTVLTLAAERGFDVVTVDEIADAAGVSARTFFNYFASKEEALVAPDPEYLPRVVHRLRTAPADLSPVAAVHQAFHGVATDFEADVDAMSRRMSLVKAHPVLLERWMSSGADGERAVAGALAERLGLAADALYPALVVSVVGSCLRTAVLHWQTAPRPGSADDRASPPSALGDLFDLAVRTVAAGMPPPAAGPA